MARQPGVRRVTVPHWPPKDWRAIIALVASIAGAAVLTGYSVWIVSLIAAVPVTAETAPLIIHALASSNYGLLGIIGAVLLSLGLAINRRSLKASAFGASFDASGGDDSAPLAAQAVADSAQDTADTIKGAQP